MVLVYLFQLKFIGDVKAVMKVLFMFLPLPVYWALFEQQVRVFPDYNLTIKSDN